MTEPSSPPTSPPRRSSGRARKGSSSSNSTAALASSPTTLAGEGSLSTTPNGKDAFNSPTSSATRQASLTRPSSTKRASVNLQKVTSGSGGSPGSATSGSSTSERRRTSLEPTARPTLTRRSSSTSKSQATSLPSRSSSNEIAALLKGHKEEGEVGAPSNAAPDDLARLTREQLVALVMRERDERGELEARLSTLTAEHTTLTGEHSEIIKQNKHLESKVQDAHDASLRLESQLAEQVEAADVLRAHLRDAEKEGREAQKRYNEQEESFSLERNALDSDQRALQAKLKKLQAEYDSLLAKTGETAATTETLQLPEAAEGQKEKALDPLSPSLPSVASPTFAIPSSTLEELEGLYDKIADLNSSHANLEGEVQRLTSEVEELRTLTANLQEENENYEVLLGERMLAGLGSFTDSGHGGSGVSIDASGIASSYSDRQSIGALSEESRSRPASSLDALEEEPYGELEGDGDGDEPEYLEGSGDGTSASGAVGARRSIIRAPRKRESVMDFSGGLNLEAELNKARREEEEEAELARKKQAQREKDRAKAQQVAARRSANSSSHLGGREGDPVPSDVEALRKEVKLLRQENKGLTTYVGRILERVIGLDGFEKVLAVDREYKSPPPLAGAITGSGKSSSTLVPPTTPAKTGFTSSVGYSSASPKPPTLRTQSTASNASWALGPESPVKSTNPPTVLNGNNTSKKNRMSMDWITSAIWKSAPGNSYNKDATSNTPTMAVPPSPTTMQNPPPGLKPMMLSTASSSSSKLPTEEDDEDQITRARLESEMKLLGIGNHGSPVLHRSPALSQYSNMSRTSSSNQRQSGDLGARVSPRPPSLPPKEDTSWEKEMQNELKNGRASGFTELPAPSFGTSPSAEGGVKVRGHRKRPSLSNRDSLNETTSSNGGISASSSLASVGLGFSYSKDSTTRSARSPSIVSLAGQKDVATSSPSGQ